jgi:hypothetical protein
MPFLQDLREFKASFDEIGNEKAALAEQNLPYEDLPFPGVEAEPPDTSAEDAEKAASLDTLSRMDLDPSVAAALGLPADKPGEAEKAPDPAQGDFDLEALLGADPGDLPDIPDESFDISSDFPDMSGESLDLPGEEPDIFSDFPDMSGESLDLPGEEPGVSGESFDLPEETPGVSGESFGLPDETPGVSDESFDLPDETPGVSGESFDLPDETPGVSGENGGEVPGETDDFDLDLDLGEGFGEADLAGENADPFDNFDLERGEPAPEEEDKAADMDLGDFTLPGIDDMVGGIPGSLLADGPGKAGESPFGGPPPGKKEPEEIRLDEYEMAQFQRTLAGYPLNLRVAIEEIITKQAVPPAQMANLVRLLAQGAPPKEAASLAGRIAGKTIALPVQKKSGEQMEAEQKGFAYIFVHKLFPIFRLFLFILIVAASSFYLIWRFIYIPTHAENIYQLGYDRISAGEYERANQRFTQAFDIHRDKDWFYRYAEAFRDQRQYIYAEEKYDELLAYYPRDKKGVLDYAAMETSYRRNYEKADLLLRRNILEFNVNDREALLAQGDNALLWGEIDPARYEDARYAYARLLERYGWTDPIAERMLRYFIRTDNLKEVIPLQSFFMDDPKKNISAETLAELGGYLLDKRTEEVRGVPDAYVEQISGVRDVLLRAVLQGPELPEAHYHLSRYYRNLGSRRDEQLTLETALRNFENAAEESVRRLVYHIDALARDAEILRDGREYFVSEEQLVKAIGLYESGLDRRILQPAPRFGRLYAAMGDLEYFTKSGDMEMTLSYYQNAERTGYSSPEMLYRMGSAYYRGGNWANALERFFAASSQLPLDRRILLALGNTCWQRGDFFAAQGYYNRLLDLLEAERSRLPILLPNDQVEYIETAERLMIARNNMGVTMESLAQRTGNPRYRSQALNFYTQSSQAWDALTRNPQTMIRLGAGDLSNPGINLAYLNSRNMLYPQAGYDPQVFSQIDKDILDPSPWEN